MLYSIHVYLRLFRVFLQNVKVEYTIFFIFPVLLVCDVLKNVFPKKHKVPSIKIVENIVDNLRKCIKTFFLLTRKSTQIITINCKKLY